MEPRRWRRLGVALAIALVTAFAVGALQAALAARRDLVAAHGALERARASLADGDLEGASSALAEAGRRSLAAERTVRGPWLRALAWAPILGRSADALLAVAEASERFVRAGGALLGTVRTLPEGLASLAPSRGRLRPEPLVALGEASAEADRHIVEALGILRGAPHRWLPGPVGDGLATAEAEAEGLHAQLTTAATLLRGAPRLLGADRPRRYFLGAQNPAELRGTGGVLGAYAILTVDGGRFSFTPFRPIQTLPAPEPDRVPAPVPGFAENYDAFRSEGRFWLAMNLSPDLPSVARVLLDAYRALEGEELDGVILADPFALQALLRVTGPVRVPGLDRTLGPGTVVPFVTVEAYGLYEDQATRKRVLGEVAQAAFQRLLARETASPRDLRALLRVAADGHLLLYSADPGIQAALERTGAGGSLRTDGRDLVALIENSAGGTKLDPFEDREVELGVELWPDGAARTTLSFRLTNETPATGLPRYVVGPRPGYAAEGESVQLVSVYCGPGCTLEAARRDGSPIELWTGSELGLPYFRDYFGTPRGASSELQVRLHRPEAWAGGPTGGTYRLRVVIQPTIRPTRLTVRIEAPDGMRFTGGSPGLVLDGPTARWTGTPGRVLDLDLRFAPPPLTRLWRALTG